jgi:hypothetical protein
MRHPTFRRKLTILFAVVFALTIVLGLNLAGYLGPRVLTDTQQILLIGGLILGFLVYGFWAGNHVKCPRCSVPCIWYSEEANQGRRVSCPQCSTIWDLGISYNSDSGG